MASSLPEIGQILAGKYRVERVLGEGGMGVVVAATHLHLDELVALKFMQAYGAGDSEFTARFMREAKATIRLKGSNIARVLDVGTLETGAPFMVMEYLEGRDLSEVIAGNGRVPPEQAVDYVLQACVGIAEAHAKQIIHRDLKPANLFLTTGLDGAPLIKILDFGISKAAFAENSDDFGQTGTAAAMGSPGYMSPEQMRSARLVDARTDIWALGTILYELLVGQSAFAAETLPMLCVKVFSEPPAPFDAASLDIPPGLEQVILQCLEKSPDDRPATVARLAAMLEPYASPHARPLVRRAASFLHGATVPTAPGISDVALDSGVQPVAVPAPTTLSGAASQKSEEKHVESRSTSRRTIALVGVVGLGLAAAIAVPLLGSGDDSTHSSSASSAQNEQSQNEQTQADDLARSTSEAQLDGGAVVAVAGDEETPDPGVEPGADTDASKTAVTDTPSNEKTGAAGSSRHAKARVPESGKRRDRRAAQREEPDPRPKDSAKSSTTGRDKEKAVSDRAESERQDSSALSAAQAAFKRGKIRTAIRLARGLMNDPRSSGGARRLLVRCYCRLHNAQAASSLYKQLKGSERRGLSAYCARLGVNL